MDPDPIRGEIIQADFDRDDCVVVHVAVPRGTAVGHRHVVLLDADEYKEQVIRKQQADLRVLRAGLPAVDQVKGILAQSPSGRPTGENDVDEARLRATTNAAVWAEEFAKIHPEIDRGLMISWFANAIETGRTAGEAKR